MSEWLKELVLKTSEERSSVGSNPTLTAITLIPRKMWHRGCGRRSFHSMSGVATHSRVLISGCSLSVRHLLWEQGQAGSTPVTRTNYHFGMVVISFVEAFALATGEDQ